MSLLDLVFPQKCLECGKEEKYICASCLAKCRNPRPVCPYCERPAIDGTTHTKCRPVYGLDGLTSLWNYGGVVRKAIVSLKYKFALEVASEIAQIAIDELKASRLIPSAQCLVPIPLFWYRKNWRGFNQTEEIGKLVAKGMGWKFEPNLLIRKKLTAPQASLKSEARSRNIQGVFAVNSSQSTNKLINQSTFVLFDDVWTTGSTIKEAAKILRRAGVKKVWGLTIAK